MSDKYYGPLYKKEITPDRYVYHISYRKSRKNILAKGILASSSEVVGYKNAVFAHNSDMLDINWYPLVLDFYEWGCWSRKTYDFYGDLDMLYFYVSTYYDIWRIDTHQLNRNWFVDNVGEADFRDFGFEAPELYILSYGDIPCSVVELCKLDERKHYRMIENRSIANICVHEIVKYDGVENKQNPTAEMHRLLPLNCDLDKYKYIGRKQFEDLELNWEYGLNAVA